MNGAASQWPLNWIHPSGMVPVVMGGEYEERKELQEAWWKHHQALLNELHLTLVVHHPTLKHPHLWALTSITVRSTFPVLLPSTEEGASLCITYVW